MTLARPGQNCWRAEQAQRVALLVDADRYYSVLARALQRAQRQVLILGWDIHSRVQLEPGAQRRRGERLDEVLAGITAANPQLHVYILVWNSAPIYALEREFLPELRFPFKVGPQVHFRYAADHPVGASHHQKLVVIDDHLAFTGGIDLTLARWDTPEHRPRHPLRRLPTGEAYGPFHDVQAGFDGDAARAAGELARRRWQRSTLEELTAPQVQGDPWPEDLKADLNSVQLALVRTEPAYEDRHAIREVASLYADAIRSARRFLYIENQYLTSRAICDVLAQRLQDSSGPQVVIVTPKHQSGPIEQSTMGFLRARRLQRLHEADVHSRLHVLCPVVNGHAVNVHSKLLIADDRILILGSANLSARSMSLDTEFNLAFEAQSATEASVVASFRNRLLAEHLGLSSARVSSAIDNGQSIAVLADGARETRRTLEPLRLDADDLERQTEALPAEVIDPDRALDEALLEQLVPGQHAAEHANRHLVLLTATTALALGLAALWSFTPLRQLTDPSELARVSSHFTRPPWGPLLAACAMVLATLLMVPITPLIVGMMLLLGPWFGALLAWAAGVTSSVIGMLLGRAVGADWVQRLAGGRITALSELLAERGILATVTARIVPVAPFTVANLALGASGLSVRDIAVGTLLGMFPGLAALALTFERVLSTARDPGPASIAILAAMVVAVLATLYWLRKLLSRLARRPRAEGNP